MCLHPCMHASSTAMLHANHHASHALHPLQLQVKPLSPISHPFLLLAGAERRATIQHTLMRLPGLHCGSPHARYRRPLPRLDVCTCSCSCTLTTAGDLSRIPPGIPTPHCTCRRPSCQRRGARGGFSRHHFQPARPVSWLLAASHSCRPEAAQGASQQPGPATGGAQLHHGEFFSNFILVKREM